MKKKLNKITILIGLICIIVGVIVGNNLFEKNSANKNKKIGYRLQIVKENTDLSQCSMSVDKNGSMNCNVNFTNGSNKKGDFVLTIYINYQQKEFETCDKYQKKYEFSLEQGQKITIPISIEFKDLPYRNNSIIFNITAGSNEHASSLKEVKSLFGINAEYNLIVYENNNKLLDNFIEDEEYEEIDTNLNFDGILLNQEFENHDIFKKPDSSIYCKANEDVNLALRFGGYSDINNYLIMLLLDNNQIKINNSQDYIFYNCLEGRKYFSKISFKAPSKTGKYELWALMAKNPINFQDNPLTVRGRSLDNSHRVTLIVE